MECKNQGESVQGIANGEDAAGFFLLRGGVHKLLGCEMALGVVISQPELGWLGNEKQPFSLVKFLLVSQVVSAIIPVAFVN